MKIRIQILCAVLFVIPSILNAQPYEKHYTYKQFYLGMPESEFLELCEGKEIEVTHNKNTGFQRSPVNPKEYNIVVTDYLVIDPENYFPGTQLLFERLHFKFVNNILYSFTIVNAEKKISKSNVKKLLKSMDALYKAKTEKVFDEPANSNNKYFGSRSYASQVIDGRLSREGQRVRLTYRLKPGKYALYGTLIYFNNYKQTLQWKSYLDMCDEYSQKGLIPFCKVDTIPLGVHRSILLPEGQQKFHLADSSTVVSVFEDSDYKDVFLQHDIFYSSEIKSFLDISVTETDLFFYQNTLRMVRLMLTNEVSTEELLSILRKAYGKEEQTKSGSYYWKYVYQDNFNETIQRTYYLEFWPMREGADYPYLFFFDQTSFDNLN